MESSSLLQNNNNESGNVDGRKRLGRPPKSKQEQQKEQYQQQEHRQLQQSQLFTSEMIESSLNECRRSARKKIIKFDVRDLLNKSRTNKTHKVQIEARIDSDVTSNNSSAVDVNDMVNYVEDIADSNNSKQIPLNSSSTNSFKVISNNNSNQLTDESKTIIENVEQQNVIFQKKRGRPPNIPNMPVRLLKLAHNMPKRGRGRPPKCRNEETHVVSPVEKLKIIKPHLSSSVSVLVKKLDLTDGQVFKVTGNNCFEKINIKNKMLVEKHKENKLEAVSPYETTVVQQDNDEEKQEEELEGDVRSEEEIIFEISSSVSTNLNRDKEDDDVIDFENLDEASEAKQNNSNHNKNNNQDERRKRNFACVAFIEQQTALCQDENATTTTAYVEDILTNRNNFTVETEVEEKAHDAGVEEVEVNKEELNNINIEEIVYDVEEVEEHETTALGDSYIVIMEMNNESSSCVITEQHVEELDLVECDINDSPHSNIISNNDNSFSMDQEQKQQPLEEEATTKAEYTMEIDNKQKLNTARTNNASAIKIDENSSSTESAEAKQQLQQINKIFTANTTDIVLIENPYETPVKETVETKKVAEEAGRQETINSMLLDCLEMDYGSDVKSNGLENTTKIQDIVAAVPVEESKMEICHVEENNEVISNADENSNRSNMDEIIDNATNLINSMAIENEFDTVSIEGAEEVHEKQNQISEKNFNENNEKFENHILEQLPTECFEKNSEDIAKTSNIQIFEPNHKETAKIANVQIPDHSTSVLKKDDEATSVEISKEILFDNVGNATLKAAAYSCLMPDIANQNVHQNNVDNNYDYDDLILESNAQKMRIDMNEISQGINVETSTLIDILRADDANNQQITKINKTNAVTVLKHNNNDYVQEKLSPSPPIVQKRRSEKRYRYVVEDARPKTLEETFAEIAEQSSKVVLEMAAVGNKQETGEEQQQHDCITDNFSIKSMEKPVHNVVMNSCHDNNNVQRTNSPKRRGRKPKQKFQTPIPAAATPTISEPREQDKDLKIPLTAAVVEVVETEQQPVNNENCHETFAREDEKINKKEKVEEIINLLSKNMQINEFDEINGKNKLNHANCFSRENTSVKLMENSSGKLLENSMAIVKKEKRKSRWDEQELRQDSTTARKLENELAMKRERHNQLKAAFKAALNEVAYHSLQENSKNTKTAIAKTTTMTKSHIKPNLKNLDLTDATLPFMLYKSMTAKLDKDILKSNHHHHQQQHHNDTVTNNNNVLLHNAKSMNNNPLSDIEKFIADGVSLLKKNTAMDAEDAVNSDKQLVHEQQTLQQQQLQAIKIDGNTAKNLYFSDIIKNNILIKNEVNIAIQDQEEETVEQNYNDEVDGEEEVDGGGGKMVFETRSKSFTIISSRSIENMCYGATLVTHGEETTAALRRSHRIKQITQAPKALVGRGLVRDKERFSLKDDVETKTAYSLDDHLTDLAEVEAKNAKFLKDMEERLSNFHVIKENEYKCEHLISKEARRMICDCFLTKEEEERGELGCGEDCLNRLLMIECGPNCNVKERCTNKRFQKFLSSPCRVFRTEKKGFGIMADIEILPGEFIMEYVGEVIDGDEFERRRTAYSLEKNRHYYFMALRSDAIIDATTKGNISRFINHSCDPNAETQKWTVNGELRIGFFSRKSIMPGEEITFDYQYQRYGREAQRCYCESANCRGWIGEEPNSDEGEQQDDDVDDDSDEEDLSDNDDDDDDSVSDPLEVQKKLEIAAAAAKLMPMSEEERHKKKHAKIEEEDSTIKFRKLLNKISEKFGKRKEEQRKASRGRPRKSLKIMNNNNDGLSPSKGRFLEDPDIEDEVNFLKINGLKNQSDTLSLSRLMVRAKLVQTRLNLLEVLRQGEEPCRRLFLDYHGLRLLHGWMNENSNNMEIRLALLKTLMRLPVTNKTVLKDSKVLQTMHNWCHQYKSLQTQIQNHNAEHNSSPSDESSKESIAVAMVVEENVGVNTVNSTNDATTSFSDIEIEVAELAEKLIRTWDNLLEIFRIPKRERLEQMKEHEREADRQYVAKLEDNSKQKLVEKNSNTASDYQQQQRDRFGRGIFNRAHNYNRPYSSRHNPMATATTTTSNDFRRRSGYDSDVIRHLSKEKRREIFAARVAREEAAKLMTSERREFEIKCRFFGLNDKRTKPHDIPFCVNTTTGQWYAFDRRPIPTPPNYRHAPMRPKYKSTNSNDYRLPEFVVHLPKNWRYAITPLGKIYYYHVKYRQAQWEPPCVNQMTGENLKKIEAESDVGIESTDDDEHVIKDMDETQFREYKEQKVEGRRRKRRNNLITERPISPRRDEDRAYNQQEVRKYKENKEKVRKRKEEIRRRRVEAIRHTLSKTTTTTALLTNEDNNYADMKLNVKNDEIYKITTTATNKEHTPDALPIQEYLLSSDEDNAADNMAQENDVGDGDHDDHDANDDNEDDVDDIKTNALLYKIVEGDKIVDELDALMTTNVSLKRPLPPLSDFSLAVQLKQQNNSNRIVCHENIDSTAAVSSSSNNFEKYELHKRRKQEKKEKEKSKRGNSSNNNNNNNGGGRSKDSDVKLRKIREKFRCDIAGIIVHYLKPYRKSNCQRGRIKNDDDYNHLARKLTHFVMIKETKYCESVGQTLVVTESVKNKSKEFIKKYMAKYGEIYEKPNNDPEFKEIPFNIKPLYDRS